MSASSSYSPYLQKHSNSYSCNIDDYDYKDKSPYYNEQIICYTSAQSKLSRCQGNRHSDDNSDTKKPSCFAKALDWYSKERKFCPSKKARGRNCTKKPFCKQSAEQSNTMSRQSTGDESVSHPVEQDLSSFAIWLDLKYKEYIREQRERKGQIKTTQTDCPCDEPKIDEEYAYQQFKLYTFTQDNSCHRCKSKVPETRDSCCQGCVKPPSVTATQPNHCENLRPVVADCYTADETRTSLPRNRECLIKLTSPSTEFSKSSRTSQQRNTTYKQIKNSKEQFARDMSHGKINDEDESVNPSEICPCPDESPSAPPPKHYKPEKASKNSKPRTESKVNCMCNDEDTRKKPYQPCACPEDPVAIPSQSNVTFVPVKKTKVVKKPTLKCLCEDDTIDDKMRLVTCPCPTPTKPDKVKKSPKRSKQEQTVSLCLCHRLKKCPCDTENVGEELAQNTRVDIPKKIYSEETPLIPVCCQAPRISTKESIAKQRKKEANEKRNTEKRSEPIKPAPEKAECNDCIECSTPENSTKAKEIQLSSEESPVIPICCQAPRISTKETIALQRKKEANEKRNTEKRSEPIKPAPEKAECNDCIECSTPENSTKAKEIQLSSEESPVIPICCQAPRMFTKETRNKEENTLLVKQTAEEVECNACIECSTQENFSVASKIQDRSSKAQLIKQTTEEVECNACIECSTQENFSVASKIQDSSSEEYETPSRCTDTCPANPERRNNRLSDYCTVQQIPVCRPPRLISDEAQTSRHSINLTPPNGYPIFMKVICPDKLN